jgi:hypothetical protein
MRYTDCGAVSTAGLGTAGDRYVLSWEHPKRIKAVENMTVNLMVSFSQSVSVSPRAG